MAEAHLIADRPMRCFGQLLSALDMADRLGATLHMTAGCLGEPTRNRPGMSSGCMPLDPVRGGDRCRHDLADLRRRGAVDISPDIECRTWGPGACTACVERQPVVLEGELFSRVGEQWVTR